MCKFLKLIFMAVRKCVLNLVQDISGKRTRVIIQQEAGVEPTPTPEYTFSKVDNGDGSYEIQSYKRVNGGSPESVDWNIGAMRGSGASLVSVSKRSGGVSIQVKENTSTDSKSWSVVLTQEESGKTLELSGVIGGARLNYYFEKINQTNNHVSIRSCKKINNGSDIAVDWSVGNIEGSGANAVIITKVDGGIDIFDRVDVNPSPTTRKWSVQLTQMESGKTLTIIGEIPGIRVEYTFEQFNISNNSVDIRSLKKVGDRDPQDLDWKLGTVEGPGAEYIDITKREGGVDISENINKFSTEPREWHVMLTQDESGKTIRLEGKVGGIDWYKFSATESTGDLKGYTYLYLVESKKRDADVPYNVIVGCSGASLVETKIFKEGLNNYLGVDVQDNVSQDPKIFKLTLRQEVSGKELKFFKFVPSLRISRGTFIVEEVDENTYFIISRGLDGKIINGSVDVSGEGRDLITLDFDKKMPGLFRVFFKENKSGKDLPYVITITQEGSGKKREINGVVKHN